MGAGWYFGSDLEMECFNDIIGVITMRILMVIPPRDGKGPVSRIGPILAQALDEIGNDVKIFYRPMMGSHIPFYHRLNQRIKDSIKFKEALKEWPSDVVVIHTGHDYKTLFRDFPLLFFGRMKGVPLIIQFHGSDLDRLRDSLFFRWLTRIELHLSSGAMFLSKEEKVFFLQYVSNIPQKIVNNPLPPLPSQENQFPQLDTPTILFVGRMLEMKGIFDLVKAFAIVRQQINCQLVMVGDGKEYDTIKSLVHNLGLENEVQLPGYLQGDALWDKYKNSTIFVLPSWREGQATVLSEAAYFGLPIITTGIRAALDIFKDQHNVLFVPPKSPEILAEKMYFLLTNPELQRQMREANQELVKSFEPEPVARRYLASLEEILEEAS